MTSYLPENLPWWQVKEAPRQGTCCWLLTYEFRDIQNTSWVAAISWWWRTPLPHDWLHDWELHLDDDRQRTRERTLRGVRCCCYFILTLYVSLPFHVSFTTSFFTLLGISRRSICIGAYHACTASWCDLRDPGWGDPGFRHCDLFAWHPSVILLMLALSCCFKDDLLRTGHISCLVATFQHCFEYVTPRWFLGSGSVLFVCVFVFCVVFCFLVVVLVLALCFWLLCFSLSPWNHIISVHYEPEAYYSIGFYCRIHTASKYLHNDLARAIRRWSKKRWKHCHSPDKGDCAPPPSLPNSTQSLSGTSKRRAIHSKYAGSPTSLCSAVPGPLQGIWACQSVLAATPKGMRHLHSHETPVHRIWKQHSGRLTSF